jgi:guanyl-specific ribonuclease Sa
MSRNLYGLLGLIGLAAAVAAGLTLTRPSLPDAADAPQNKNDQPAAHANVPDKVLKVLAYVDEKGEPMPGYEGGRHFGNFEKRLPAADKDGKHIQYREWDVNPHHKGVNRGVERLITGSDFSAYFTDDHYQSFKRIR